MSSKPESLEKNLKKEDGSDEAIDAQEESSEGGTGNPLKILFPPDVAVWQASRVQASDKNIRVEDLALCASQDPVIVMELLRVANAMFFSGGRSPITSTRTAILRLGSEVVIECLERLKEHPQVADKAVATWVEVYRSKCRRTAIVARILAEAIARTLSDDCQTSALFMYVGEMLAVLYYRERYVEWAEDRTRSALLYKLSNEHNFDVETRGLMYLRRQGLPEAAIFAIDREAAAKSADRAIMRPLCFAASEMLEAFDNNRWDRLAPGKFLAPKSFLRVLQMSDAQYLKVYERVSEYLFSARLLEEKKRQEATQGFSGSFKTLVDEKENKIEPAVDSEETALHSEIQFLLNQGSADYEEQEIVEEEKKEVPVETETETENILEKTTVFQELDHKLPFSEEDFSLGGPSKRNSTPRVQHVVAKKETPKLPSRHGTKVISNLSMIIESASSSEDLLTELLGMLVDNGPFAQSALIVVSKDRKNAIVVAARGSALGSGQRIQIDDPLSPLSQCFSKIQSFGNKISHTSPFGSRAFALAPIDADHETPVALYADCGHEGSLSFEARRIFRIAVDILNQRLPELPGGIPVELE